MLRSSETSHACEVVPVVAVLNDARSGSAGN
jgi:hypothetical protein